MKRILTIAMLLMITIVGMAQNNDKDMKTVYDL